MKRRLNRFTGLVALISFTVLAGCGDDPASAGNSSHGTMSAKVNGADWNAGQVTQATWQNGVFGIGGSGIDGGNNRQILISGLVQGPGEYSIGGFTGLQGNYSDGSASSVRTFVATGGTLKIDELDESGASGTFSFQATEQVPGGGQGTEQRNITEGRFDVTF